MRYSYKSERVTARKSMPIGTNPQPRLRNGLREHARCMRTSLPSTPQLGRAIGFALHNPQELLEAISSRALSRSAAIE